MYVCMYIYIYIHIIYIYTHDDIFMYPQYMYISTIIYKITSMCIIILHNYIHVHIYITCIYNVYIYIYMNICIYIYIEVHVYIYTVTYIHSYIHTLSLFHYISNHIPIKTYHCISWWLFAPMSPERYRVVFILAQTPQTSDTFVDSHPSLQSPCHGEICPEHHLRYDLPMGKRRWCWENNGKRMPVFVWTPGGGTVWKNGNHRNMMIWAETILYQGVPFVQTNQDELRRSVQHEIKMILDGPFSTIHQISQLFHGQQLDCGESSPHSMIFYDFLW